MPETLHPGVYIEERPVPQTIEGVSTSTAGFVGATEKGPTSGLPVLVTSFADFTRLFGSFLPEDPWGDRRFLAYSVDGFFRNGGQRLFVKRVVGPGATASFLTLNDGFVTRLLQDTASKPADRNTVRLGSLVGVQVGTSLKFSQILAGSPVNEIVAVQSYDAAKQTVTFANPLANRYTAAGCTVTLDPPGTSVPRLRVEASSPGSWGDALRVSVSPSYGASALAQAAGVETTLRAEELAFNAAGPGINATQVVVDAASFGKLEDGDEVEFRQGSDAETRAITKGAANAISWTGGLTKDYSAAGSKVFRLTAIRRSIPLQFDSDGPDTGATSIKLRTASYGRLANNDAVEFENAAHEVEQRTITKDPNDVISWTGALTHSFKTGSSVRLLVKDPVVPVTDSQGFAVNDPVRLIQGSDRQPGKVKAVTGLPTPTITLDTTANPLAHGYRAGDRIVVAVAGRGDRLELTSANNFYPKAVVEVDTGQTKTYHKVKKVDGRALVFEANLGADVLSETAVRVVEFGLRLDDGTTTETYDGLSMEAGAPRFVEDAVNPASRLAKVTAILPIGTPPFHLPRTADGLPAPLRNGAVGAPPEADDYIGADNGPGKRSGIKALADIDPISLIAAPGISDPSVQGELIAQCELLKDRFAVLDPQKGSVIGGGAANDVLVQRSQFDTLYAALYYPWLRARDPLSPQARDGVLMPPSGHVLGIYARVDVERGVHKAPANEVVRGILGLEVKVSDREQDILNPAPVNINVIRDFRENGRGVRVWGSRVITSDNAWKYVPVRRLFIFIEESLDEGLQFVVFEPNGEDLWARVRRTIGGFLRRLWLDGALAGVSEAEAFFVRCDRTTMTEDDLQNGRLIVLVGVAPLRPAEFVIVRISQKTLTEAS